MLPCNLGSCNEHCRRLELGHLILISGGSVFPAFFLSREAWTACGTSGSPGPPAAPPAAAAWPSGAERPGAKRPLSHLDSGTFRSDPL